jgi:hypothetical protein
MYMSRIIHLAMHLRQRWVWHRWRSCPRTLRPPPCIFCIGAGVFREERREVGGVQELALDLGDGLAEVSVKLCLLLGISTKYARCKEEASKFVGKNAVDLDGRRGGTSRSYGSNCSNDTCKGSDQGRQLTGSPE